MKSERIVQRKDENIVIILITSVFLNFYFMRVFIQECSLSKDKNVRNVNILTDERGSERPKRKRNEGDR